MFRGRRRKGLRRAVAIVAAAVVQLWSLAPVAASVIYCIGDDGHSGFEVMRAGARGCAACCHEELAATAHAGDESRVDGELQAGGEVHAGESEVPECTDIAMAPSDGLATKSIDPLGSAALAALLPVPLDGPLARREFVRSEIPTPRGSPTRLRRQTVLLI